MNHMTTDHPTGHAAESPAPRSPRWEAPDAGTWEADLAHQTEPASATLRELLPANYAEGFRRSFTPLGLPISHLAAEIVEGWTYTSAFVHDAPRGASKPPPAFVMKLLGGVHRGFRRRARLAAAALADDHAGAEAERWFAMRDGWIRRNLALEDVDPAQLADDDLARHVRDTADHLADGLLTHFSLLAPAAVVGEYLLAIDRWGIDPSLAATAAFHGTPTTMEAERRLDALVDELGGTVPGTPGAIRAHSPRAAELYDDYVRHHGGWVLGDDVTARRLAELPDVVVATIDAHRLRRASAVDHDRAATALATIRSLVPDPERAELDRLAQRAQRAYSSLDDNSGLTAAWPGGIARRAQLAAAERLVEAGRLEASDDIWTLTPDEIVGLLTGAPTPSAEEIADRVVERAWQRTLTPPPFLGAPPSPPPDPGVFASPVAELTRRMMRFIGAKFGTAEQAIGVGSVTVRGRAVVVSSAHEALERLEPGDILVTQTTTPAYNVVLPIVGGLVTAFGGPNSHPAVVARELGVPAVVGWTGAPDRIPDGAQIELDPVTADVRIIA